MSVLERQLENKSLSNAYIIEGANLEEVLAYTISFGEKIFSKYGIDLDHTLNPDFQIINKDFIDIGTIRSLIKDMVIRPENSKIKIYIIHNASHLRSEAANAMLKSLEELKDYVIVFFTTDNSLSILPTIRSRCQIVNVNISKSQDLYDLQKLSEIIVKVYKGDLVSFYQNKDFLLSYDENKYPLLDNMMKIFSDLLIYKTMDKESELSSYDYDLENLAGMSIRSIEGLIDKISLISRAYKTNINQELSIENIFFNIYREGRKK